MGSYKELKVWNKAIDLFEEIYRLVKMLPQEERFALSDQMRRAAVSIPSNIAEGHGRNSRKEFIRFLYIAQGSRAELETQLHICMRLGYLSAEQINPVLHVCSEIEKMLYSLIQSMA